MNSQKIRILALSVLSGVVIDFLFNGVLKVIWFAIYGVVYLTLASTLYSYLYQKRGNRFAVQAGGALLAGCLLSHLLFTNLHETRTYPMSLISDSRIVLQSPELSQTLYVASDRVMKALGKLDMKATVPVSIQVIKDYGCIWSFKIATVAGVDVMTDAGSTWVWRQEDSRPAPAGGFSGLNEENQRRPWCQIKTGP